MAKETKSDSSSYPVSLTIDYPDRLNRLTSVFRIILILPILGIAILIGGPGWGGGHHHHHAAFPFIVGGIIFLPTVLMILFRWKYPKW